MIFGCGSTDSYTIQPPSIDVSVGLVTFVCTRSGQIALMLSVSLARAWSQELLLFGELNLNNPQDFLE